MLVADHQAPERPALRVAPGEVVRVGEWDAEWPAFVFVTTDRGAGWIPGRYLAISDSSGTVVTGYDTTELTVGAGEEVEVIVDDSVSGWSWCRSDAGLEGWVPNRALAET